MPSFTLTALTAVPRSLGPGEAGRIESSGYLLSTVAPAVTMSGPSTLLNLGTILSTQNDGVRITGGTGAVIVNQGRIVTGEAGGASGIEFLGLAPDADLTIVNTGSIESRSPSGFGVFLRTGGVVIDNRGSILSRDSGAIVVLDLNGGTEGVTILNTGSIIGRPGDGTGDGEAILLHNNDADRIVNTGVIEGDVFTGGGDDRIENFGLIGGILNTGEGNDLVLNEGVIGLLPDGGSRVMALGAGNDTLDARFADLPMAVMGGQGDDLYLLGGPSVTVIEDAGGGTDTVQSGADFDLFLQEIEVLILTGGAIRGSGSPIGNRITGNTQGNLLDGRGGNDTLSGGAGADTLIGGDGDDSLAGGTENDSLTGDAGNDTLSGADHDDSLSGGAGDDSLRGGTGNDLLQGDGGLDILFGDAGEDALFGGTEADRLTGGTGRDLLDGGAGADTLRGEADGDTLTGGAGRDLLSGGPGSDRLTGGSEADVFEFRSLADSGPVPGGRDVITDFQPGVDDLDFAGLGLNLAPGGASGGIGGGFTGGAGEVIFRLSGGGGLVEVDADGDGVADFALELTGVFGLSGGDFVL